MKRTELKRTTPLVARTGLARGPVQLRRQPMARTRPPAQRPTPAPSTPGWSAGTRETVARRSGGLCEPRLIDCTGTATDLHHRQRRREGNHTPGNALHCCRSCHGAIHRAPAISRLAGWIVSAWDEPGAVPVKVRGRLAWLTDDGRLVGEATP